MALFPGKRSKHYCNDDKIWDLAWKNARAYDFFSQVSTSDNCNYVAYILDSSFDDMH